MNTYYTMQIIGDKMSFTYDVNRCYKEKRDDCTTLYKDDPVFGTEKTLPMVRCERTHKAMYRYFFQCIRSNKTDVNSCQRGLETMRILDAMTASIEQGGQQIIL